MCIPRCYYFLLKTSYLWRRYTVDGCPVGVQLRQIGKCRVRVVNFSYEEADPSRGGEARALQILALCTPTAIALHEQNACKLNVESTYRHLTTSTVWVK